MEVVLEEVQGVEVVLEEVQGVEVVPEAMVVEEEAAVEVREVVVAQGWRPPAGLPAWPPLASCAPPRAPRASAEYSPRT